MDCGVCFQQKNYYWPRDKCIFSYALLTSQRRLDASFLSGRSRYPPFTAELRIDGCRIYLVHTRFVLTAA
jgi:hypothetical protein